VYIEKKYNYRTWGCGMRMTLAGKERKVVRNLSTALADLCGNTSGHLADERAPCWQNSINFKENENKVGMDSNRPHLVQTKQLQTEVE
jgi:hypothetical protein